jgi:thiamine biosynthesis lipoprotein
MIERYEKTFLALGTMNTIWACGRNSSKAVTAAAEKVLDIHSRMSAYEEESNVARINSSAGRTPQIISPDTFGLLRKALLFSELSSGAFDITVRPLVQLWGIGKKQDFIPSPEEISQALRLVNFRDLLLDEENCTAFLRKPGMAIDLGGIAKGYAADEVRRILLEHGIGSALVNLGGNIVTVGLRDGVSPWQIGIQNPLSPRGGNIGTMEVRDRTVVTSGSYERFFVKDGIRYHHILDPRTGYPAGSGLLSVTAVCGSSTEADALTTALFVSGTASAVQLLESFDAQAVFVAETGDIFLTEGLTKTFIRS